MEEVRFAGRRPRRGERSRHTKRCPSGSSLPMAAFAPLVKNPKSPSGSRRRLTEPYISNAIHKPHGGRTRQMYGLRTIDVRRTPRGFSAGYDNTSQNKGEARAPTPRAPIRAFEELFWKIYTRRREHADAAPLLYARTRGSEPCAHLLLCSPLREHESVRETSCRHTRSAPREFARVRRRCRA